MRAVQRGAESGEVVDSEFNYAGGTKSATTNKRSTDETGVD